MANPLSFRVTGKIPARYANLVFGLLLSGIMTLLISGLTTFINLGFARDFFSVWMHAYGASWVLAFPIVVVVAPFVRKVVNRLVAPSGT